MSKKIFTIIRYHDPAHSWGKVKRKVLTSLGVEDKISQYSYQFNDNVYLEEDNDLPLIVEAIRKHGTTVRFIDKHTNKESRVRTYEPFASN